MRHEYKSYILESADALDAVICGFAAIAVTRGTIAIQPMPIAVDEGGSQFTRST